MGACCAKSDSEGVSSNQTNPKKKTLKINAQFDSDEEKIITTSQTEPSETFKPTYMESEEN